MGDSYRIGPVSDSAVAVGRGSRASRTTIGAAPDVSALRRELADLVARLDAMEPSRAVQDARRHAVTLGEDVAEGSEPVIVRRSWSKLQAAAGTLAVGANLAQIADLVGPFLS